MAESKLKEGELYSTGDLVHNPKVIEYFHSLGLKDMEEMKEYRKKRILIQAHGAPLNIIEELKERNCIIYDGTCPIVQKSFDISYKLEKKGYFVLVLGNKNHPEMRALKSNVCTAKIFENEKELSVITESQDFKNVRKISLTAQTTRSKEEFQTAVNSLILKLGSFKKITVVNTICKATIQREEEVEIKSVQTECVLIIGGKNSSNTKKLVSIAGKKCKNVLQITGLENLKENLYKVKDFSDFFLTSGTSTPEEEVFEIKEYLLRNLGG